LGKGKGQCARQKMIRGKNRQKRTFICGPATDEGFRVQRKSGMASAGSVRRGMTTYDKPMKRSPRTAVQRSRVLPARQYQGGRKFDVRSAREENHRQQVNRNSSNRIRRIKCGREPNGSPVGGKSESSMEAVILIHAQQRNRATYRIR